MTISTVTWKIWRVWYTFLMWINKNSTILYICQPKNSTHCYATKWCPNLFIFLDTVGMPNFNWVLRNISYFHYLFEFLKSSFHYLCEKIDKVIRIYNCYNSDGEWEGTNGWSRLTGNCSRAEVTILL